MLETKVKELFSWTTELEKKVNNFKSIWHKHWLFFQDIDTTKEENYLLYKQVKRIWLEVEFIQTECKSSQEKLLSLINEIKNTKTNDIHKLEHIKIIYESLLEYLNDFYEDIIAGLTGDISIIQEIKNEDFEKARDRIVEDLTRILQDFKQVKKLMEKIKC